jgi:hypothetical protein
VARLVVDEGRTLGDALHRAAQDNGTRIRSGDVDLEELRTQINEYRTLFRPAQLAVLRANRTLALEAMRSLQAFDPRLFGSLVHGDGPVDTIRLLLTADTPESVMLALGDMHIPWREDETALMLSPEGSEMRPALRFQAGDAEVELVIVSERDRRRSPRDLLGRQPMRLLTAAQLRTLIAGADDA